MKERFRLKKLIKDIATGYTAANAAFAGGGIPTPDLNPVPGIIRPADSAWVREAPLDPVVVRENRAKEREVRADLKVFHQAIERFVDDSLDPDFWAKMREQIRNNPEEYLSISEETTGNNILPNIHTYSYYHNGKSKLNEVSIPSVAVTLTDPDGFDILNSSFQIILQLGSDRNLSSYTSDINLISPENYIPRQELELLTGSYFLEPLGMAEVSWEQNPGTLQGEPIEIDRGYLDEAGIFYFQWAAADGFIYQSIDLPFPPGFQPSEEIENTSPGGYS